MHKAHLCEMVTKEILVILIAWAKENNIEPARKYRFITWQSFDFIDFGNVWGIGPKFTKNYNRYFRAMASEALDEVAYALMISLGMS